MRLWNGLAKSVRVRSHASHHGMPTGKSWGGEVGAWEGSALAVLGRRVSGQTRAEEEGNVCSFVAAVWRKPATTPRILSIGDGQRRRGQQST